MGSDFIKQQGEDAWIGDAVLSVYARTRVLREQGKISANDERLLVSNRIINSYAQPTKTEALIGRRFRESGFDAAMLWIRENLEPVWAKQTEKRMKASGGSKVAAARERKTRRKR